MLYAKHVTPNQLSVKHQKAELKEHGRRDPPGKGCAICAEQGGTGASSPNKTTQHQEHVPCTARIGEREKENIACTCQCYDLSERVFRWPAKIALDGHNRRQQSSRAKGSGPA